MCKDLSRRLDADYEREALIAEEVRAAASASLAEGHERTRDVESVETTVAIAPLHAAEQSD